MLTTIISTAINYLLPITIIDMPKFTMAAVQNRRSTHKEKRDKILCN